MSDKHDISRRGLFRGDWFKKIRERGQEQEEPEFQLKRPKGQMKWGSEFVHRPPHAVVESEFLAGCTRCADCIEVCPPNAIFNATDEFGLIAGTPIINAEEQPCIMCDDLPCVHACEPGVLRFEAPLQMGLAEINEEQCFAFQGKQCSECVTHCPVDGAISLLHGKPLVNADSCTGCGMCVYVCPSEPQTISLAPSLGSDPVSDPVIG